MTTIYLAGKMGGGQSDICDCGREVSCHPHCQPDHVEHAHNCGAIYEEDNWRRHVLGKIPLMNERCTFSRGYVFGGPWFIDNHNHGMDADHVATQCLGWVTHSNAVFAWITSLDAHGTYAEMGYAKGLGKPVFAAFDRDSLNDHQIRELWFIKQLADDSCVVRNPRTAFAIFTHWLAARNTVSLTYGNRW